jgi:Spy/CpxP family protein refolding chaperone
MPEMEALQGALDKADTPEADIQTKLKEFRAARQKQEDELKASQEKLRALLTPRQEATCVLMGLLN